MAVRLEQLINATRERLERRKRERPLAELEREVAQRGEGRPFHEALAHPGTSLVAEYKRRSPSAGTIRDNASVTEIVQAYERGAVSGLPILRKDFTVDPYQLYEARAAGADAVLLVVGSLTDDELGRLYLETRALDLDALVEIHDEEELERALEVDADVIGINNRDLMDFTVDLSRTFDLLADVPAGKTVVSESGIVYREQVDELERVGVDAVLVGETLMRAGNPEFAVRELTGAEDTLSET
jgi:indole-3-glycerol phosphate synthase